MTIEEVKSNVVDVSKRCAESELVRIIEIGTLGCIIPLADAEGLRQLFTEKRTKVKQLSNTKPVNWTEVDGMEDLVEIRVVPEGRLLIDTEMVMFDDTVAIYRPGPNPLYKEIRDRGLAAMMIQMFDHLWEGAK